MGITKESKNCASSSPSSRPRVPASGASPFEFEYYSFITNFERTPAKLKILAGDCAQHFVQFSRQSDSSSDADVSTGIIDSVAGSSTAN